jgi:hypothetical protein
VVIIQPGCFQLLLNEQLMVDISNNSVSGAGITLRTPSGGGSVDIRCIDGEFHITTGKAPFVLKDKYISWKYSNELGSHVLCGAD